MTTLLLTLAASWFYTTNSATATKFATALDQACGYPNRATLTERAVMVQTNATKTATNYWVICPDGIYAPKLRSYLATVSVLPKERQTNNVVTNETALATALAKASTNTVPTPKEGTLAAQDFVLATEAVMTKVATNISAVGEATTK